MDGAPTANTRSATTSWNPLNQKHLDRETEMLIVSADKQKMKAASFVARHADLLSVVLLGVKTNGDPSALRPGKKSSTGGFGNGAVSFARTRGARFVEVVVSVLLSNEESETVTDHTADLQIKTTWRATYDIPSEPIPDDVGAEALKNFAELNGLTNCWPYARAEIQAITTAMGLPAFTMPLLMVRAAEEVPSEVDGDLTSEK